jgi:hypothetical protein
LAPHHRVLYVYEVLGELLGLVEEAIEVLQHSAFV